MMRGLRRFAHLLCEELRVNAARRLFAEAGITKIEASSIALLAVAFGALEGVGLSLLLPVLQYAESGERGVAQTGGAFWSATHWMLQVLHIQPTLLSLLVLAFVPILARQVVYYLNVWRTAAIAARATHRLRLRATEALLQADVSYHDRQRAGHLVGALTTQCEAAGEAIMLLARMLAVSMLLVIYAGILMTISLALTAISAVFGAAIWFVVRRLVSRTRRISAIAVQASQDFTARMLEVLSAIRLVKMRAAEPLEQRLASDLSEHIRSIRVKQARLGASMEVYADPILMLSAFATLYFGVVSLHMSIAQIGLIMFVLSRLNAKVKEFNDSRQQIAVKAAGLSAVREMTQGALRARQRDTGVRRFEGVNDAIRFEGVWFRHLDSDEPESASPTVGHLIRDLTLEIPAGSFTAIVGRSGQGKTTLIELIPRLREPSEGRISIDGIDLRDFDLGSLRRGIGYLTQDPLLFNASVRYNLTYGLETEVSDAAIRDALEQASAEFVFALPRGLDTCLGDRGVRLSGGERQRIALARVLLQRAPILLLDEPTSALDSESEAAIHDALERLRGVCTIITVAHRLATVMSADRILVLEGASIVQSGRHEELVAADGPYRHLFERQFIK